MTSSKKITYQKIYEAYCQLSLEKRKSKTVDNAKLKLITLAIGLSEKLEEIPDWVLDKCREFASRTKTMMVENGDILQAISNVELTKIVTKKENPLSEKDNLILDMIAYFFTVFPYHNKKYYNTGKDGESMRSAVALSAAIYDTLTAKCWSITINVSILNNVHIKYSKFKTHNNSADALYKRIDRIWRSEAINVYEQYKKDMQSAKNYMEASSNNPALNDRAKSDYYEYMADELYQYNEIDGRTKDKINPLYANNRIVRVEDFARSIGLIQIGMSIIKYDDMEHYRKLKIALQTMSAYFHDNQK